ncbi:MAG: arsenic resistance protein [Planctomycetota bacterium]|jgi:ACR3 family arsenite efflux pump ArsB
MKYLWRLSLFLKRQLLFVIPLTVILAIVAGYAWDLIALKQLTIPFTILIVYPMMIGLPLRSVVTLTDTKVLLVTQIVNFAIIPFIGYGVSLLFFRQHPSLVLGFLLVALLPTSGGMTISWTGLARGNIQAAVKMTVIGLLLGTLCAPLYLKVLMGRTVAIPFFQVGQAILLIVFLPLLLGQLTRVLVLKHVGEQLFATKIKPLLPACSTWGLIGIIFVAIAAKAQTLVKSPALIIRMAVPLILFYLLTYFVASLVGRFCLSREDAIALVYGTALRSLSIALVLAITVFRDQGAEMGLLVALAYIVQIQSATWYARLSERIFRGANEKVS